MWSYKTLKLNHLIKKMYDMRNVVLSKYANFLWTEKVTNQKVLNIIKENENVGI